MGVHKLDDFLVKSAAQRSPFKGVTHVFPREKIFAVKFMLAVAASTCVPCSPPRKKTPLPENLLLFVRCLRAICQR